MAVHSMLYQGLPRLERIRILNCFMGANFVVELQESRNTLIKPVSSNRFPVYQTGSKQRIACHCRMDWNAETDTRSPYAVSNRSTQSENTYI